MEAVPRTRQSGDGRPLPSGRVSPVLEFDLQGAESGLDNFGAGYDSSSLGSFMTPDRIYMELYRLLDPQALNLYAYVRNNPLGLTDPSGMLIDIDCSKVSSDQRWTQKGLGDVSPAGE